MLSQCHAPPALTTSYIIPTLKGKSLDPTNPSNYRGISVSSVLNKLLEKVIMGYLPSQLFSRIHSLQGGFCKGYGPSHTSLIVQEAILHTRESGMKCFVALLDARKAFDCVWHNGLLVKLFHYGIKGNLWLLLHFWYQQLTSVVRWEANVSRSFSILQGVYQGALLSPLLYAIFINDLLIELSCSKVGVSIGPIYYGYPTYADDMALLATSQNDLQTMIDVAAKMYIIFTKHLFALQTVGPRFGCLHPHVVQIDLLPLSSLWSKVYSR